MVIYTGVPPKSDEELILTSYKLHVPIHNVHMIPNNIYCKIFNNPIKYQWRIMYDVTYLLILNEK